MLDIIDTWARLLDEKEKGDWLAAAGQSCLPLWDWACKQNTQASIASRRSAPSPLGQSLNQALAVSNTMILEPFDRLPQP